MSTINSPQTKYAEAFLDNIDVYERTLIDPEDGTVYTEWVNDPGVWALLDCMACCGFDLQQVENESKLSDEEISEANKRIVELADDMSNQGIEMDAGDMLTALIEAKLILVPTDGSASMECIEMCRHS